MKFRFARHTNNLNALVDFYTEIIGLEKLGEFKNHDGYDGVFLGIKNTDWHIEFTQSDNSINHQPKVDDLLVFYLNEAELENILIKIDDMKLPIIKSQNPYWEKNGMELKDPEGYGVIISKNSFT